jgi:membrane fusion protein, heavy metal efflux system
MSSSRRWIAAVAAAVLVLALAGWWRAIAVGRPAAGASAGDLAAVGSAAPLRPVSLATPDADDDDDERESDDDDDEDDDGEQAIRLSEAQRAEFGIELAAAGPSRIESAIELPGEVEPNANRLARVAPRFEGLVTDLRKAEGDWVEKGDVLARVESNESLAVFELRAPIAGTVVERNAALGETISREQPAFVLIDLRSVWVDLDVAQRDLGRIHTGQSVRIRDEAGTAEATGTIAYVAPRLREETRTARARVVLANPDGHWRPGLFVTGAVLLGDAEVAVAVPLDAVQRLEQREVVFVEDDGRLEPRRVKLGRADATRVEIVAGLEPGDRIVASGGFLLKSELQKAAFGDDDD